jgi:TrmH family RNA methyltransferase
MSEIPCKNLSAIRVVMVNTTHPGNIGAVARAMKNMCLSSLYLVGPKFFPHEEATARSSGATDILENAVVCDSLQQAIADCRLVIGTSARERSVNWQVLTPAECGEKLVSAASVSPVAIVMGRESSGLSNDELDLCNFLVHIPSNPDYSSLNVAMAVQVLAYEIQCASQRGVMTETTDVPELTAIQMQHFYEHLEQTLFDIGFIHSGQSEKLMRRLRRFFTRANPTADEMRVLRGILSSAQGRKSMRK